MLISLILVTGALALLFALKERFDRSPALLRYGVFGILVLLMGTLLTMEFMIYVHERIRAFLDAVAGIPGVFIVALFLLFLVLSAWAVLLVASVDRDNFRHFLHDTFMPKARETVREVAISGWLGWRGLRRRIGSRLRRFFAPPWSEGGGAPEDGSDSKGTPEKRQ